MNINYRKINKNYRQYITIENLHRELNKEFIKSNFLISKKELKKKIIDICQWDYIVWLKIEKDFFNFYCKVNNIK